MMKPGRKVRKVKIGTSTRSAVMASPNLPFEIDLPRGPTAVAFSFGVLEPAVSQHSIRFTVSAKAKAVSGWRTIFDELAEGSPPAWKDRVLSLRDLAPDAKTLRFETICPAPPSCMKMRPYWGSLVLLVPTTEESKKASVILVSLDTLGAQYLTSFGGPAGVSPHIDDVLKRSFSFRRAYTQYPNTPNSHASLFTGLYPKHHQMYDRQKVGFETLAEILARNGYLTAAVTEDAYVSSDFGFDRGFDWYDNGTAKVETKFLGDASGTFQKSLEWMKEYGDRAPFFLFVHTYEVHAPYTPRDEDALAVVRRLDPNYAGPFANSFNNPLAELKHNNGSALLAAAARRHLAALYTGEIRYLDRKFHDFMEHLSSLPFADRTLVIVVSDHGEEFGRHGKLGHGETLYNDALHVPLGFYWPGRIKGGASQMPVQLVDVLPTVLDILDIPHEGLTDGRSLAGLIRDEVGALASRPVFAEVRIGLGDCKKLKLPKRCRVNHFAVQTDRFKLIRSEVPPFEALYDIASDPTETRDVRAQFPQEWQRLKGLLSAYAADEGNRAGTEGEPVPAPTIGEETLERLRALGYQ